MLAGSAWGQEATPARRELEQGYDLRSKGNYVEALPHLLESYRLEPQIKTLINLADCEEHVGKLVDARSHWTIARDQASRESNVDIRDEAVRRVAALEKLTPKLKISLSPGAPPTAVVDEDGRALATTSLGTFVPTDPGRHLLTVHADGYEVRSFEVILQASETREFTVTPGARAPEGREATTPPEPSPPRPLRIVGIVTAGVGLVGVGLGSYFGVDAINKQNDANCPNNRCAQSNTGGPDKINAAMTSGTLSTIFFVAGGVLVAGGVTLWLVAPRGKPAGAQVGAAPVVSRDGGGLAVVGRW
jgi:hypothetical protein